MGRKKDDADDLLGVAPSPKTKKKAPKGKREKTGEERALDSMLADLEKKYGRGAVMVMGDAPPVTIETIPTGSIRLDQALGDEVGGYPRGRVVEIFGPESSGKTTITLHAIAEAQKKGGRAAFIDAEHALDISYAAKLGVDVDALVMSQPDYGEQALEIAETMVRSSLFSIVVIDSVSALVPKAEVDGEMGDSHVGLQARLMSQACRKLSPAANATNTTVFFVNQIRLKIGVMFGNPETTSGGNALKFYSSVRLDIRRSGSIKDGDVVKGHKARVKVVKNKLAPPFRVAEFDIIYGKGINRAGEVLDMAVEKDFVEKRGANYYYNEEKFAVGRNKAIDVLNERPDLMRSIEEEMFGIPFIEG